MSDYENPYQSPETPIVPETTQNSGVLMTETMLQYLYEASPWLRFVGIIGYIGSGMAVLFGIIFAFSTALASSFLGDDLGVFPSWIFVLLYIPFGVLFFFPAHFTFNFGRKLRNYRFNSSIEDLELAFKNNKSFWKFIGIITIVYIAIIPLAIVGTIIASVVAAVGGM
ncbi:MAG: hypothetical protein LBQ93_09410 [Treponema sp.]|jgi:hypothetical protein|nr:hypothetical protein [Treponema sp.]